MAGNIDTELILSTLDEFRSDVREDFREVKAKQDYTNGRVREAEMAIAVLQDRAQRAEQAAHAAAQATTKVTSSAMGSGAGAGAALVAAFEFVKWLYGVLAS